MRRCTDTVMKAVTCAGSRGEQGSQQTVSNIRVIPVQQTHLTAGESGLACLHASLWVMCAHFFYFFYIFYTLLSLSGNLLGRLTWVRLQQLQEQRYPVLQVHAGSFRVSRNLPNSDMDYRIFNVHAWSFLCVRVHTGVGQNDSESAPCFWLGKTH